MISLDGTHTKDRQLTSVWKGLSHERTGHSLHERGQVLEGLELEQRQSGHTVAAWTNPWFAINNPCAQSQKGFASAVTWIGASARDIVKVLFSDDRLGCWIRVMAGSSRDSVQPQGSLQLWYTVWTIPIHSRPWPFFASCDYGKTTLVYFNLFVGAACSVLSSPCVVSKFCPRWWNHLKCTLIGWITLNPGFEHLATSSAILGHHCDLPTTA